MKKWGKNCFKKLLITSVILILIIPVFSLLFYYYNNRLFSIEAKILWNQTPFAEEDFRSGSSSIRASMVVDLIKSNKYIGESCSSITNKLGEKTGDYYHSDSNSTYRLTEKTSANWILTFVCGQSGNVDRVIIRKSCCTASQKFLFWSLENINTLIK
jgi:hypothetical protein